MTREEFAEQLKIAVAFNESLPDWKRNILVSCSKATVDVPRKPVDNFAEDATPTLNYRGEEVMSDPTPKMPLPWIANPAYADDDMPPFLVGDRILVAVPLGKLNGGGFDISVITVEESAWADSNGESWSAWDWSDVSHYVPLDGVRKPMEDRE